MPDRSTQPPFQQSYSWKLPSPVTYDQPNGASVVHLDHLHQPILKLELIFKAGRWFEPDPGVSYFTAHMLEKGTMGHSAHEIATFFDRLGTFLEISSGPDMVMMELYCLRKYFQESVSLLMELIGSPVFDTEELGLMKEIYTQQLRVNNGKTDFAASRNLKGMVFGKQHPYGRAIDEPAIVNIDPKALASFHQSDYSLNEVYVTGELSTADLDYLQQQVQAAQQHNNKALVFNPPNENPVESHEPFENGVQSSIRIGRRAVSKLHPDYPALLLSNHILGGYFGSRLMTNIREEKGLTYGIYSTIQSFQNDSLWVIGADVNKDKAQEAIGEIKKELAAMCALPIDDDELEVAKNHLMGSGQLELANPFSVTDKVKWARIMGLHDDFYPNLIDSVRDCKPDRLVEVANKYFQEDNWHCAVAG